MTTTTFDRPVRLIRVQPNPVFQEPRHLPIKPLTQAPIEIERPSDYLSSCIHRKDFKDIHPDLLKQYAQHYDIKVDYEKILRAEIMAVLCMKNEWIPILPEHDATQLQGDHVLLSTTATQSTPEGDGDAPTGPDPEVETYIPDRFGTPEDTYDDPAPSTEATDPNLKNPDADITEDINFDLLPSTLSLGDLTELTSRLQARHTKVQSALADATAATREAAANVLEMMARLENEKATMKKIMGTVAEIVGEYDENIEESHEELDEEVESNLVSEKRKGKERASEPTHSSAHSSIGRGRNLPGLRRSPLCPNCRVARDLTVSQRHSVYLCAEHMPNPYEATGTPNEGSQVSAHGSTSGSTAERRKLDLSSTNESTIIFGLTTKPVSTLNSASKGKKRALEESEADASSATSDQSPKRARLEESEDNIQSRDPPSTTSASKESAPLTQATPVGDFSDPGVEREEVSAAPEWREALRRRFTIEDFEDPEEVARVERMEALCASVPRTDAPVIPSTNLNVPAVATPTTQATSRRTLSSTDLKVRQQRQLRRRRPPQTPDTNVPANLAIPQASTSTSNRSTPLRRTVSVLDLNDLEEVANAAREEKNLEASSTPASGPTISEGPAIVVPTPRTKEPLSRTFSICMSDPMAMAESTCSSSSSSSPGKRPRDSDDDGEESGQRRIRKKGRGAGA